MCWLGYFLIFTGDVKCVVRERHMRPVFVFVSLSLSLTFLFLDIYGRHQVYRERDTYETRLCLCVFVFVFVFDFVLFVLWYLLAASSALWERDIWDPGERLGLMPCLSINPAFFLHFYLFSSIDPLICLDFYFSAPLFLSIWPSINAAFLFSIFFLNCLLINPKIMFGNLSSFVSQPIPQIFFQLFLNQSRNFILLCFIFCQTVFLTWFLNQSVLFF